MKRGDVVTVAPPREFGKPRPALIVQSDLVLPAPNLIYLPITSDLMRVPDVRVPVNPTLENGLRHPSEIMVDLVHTAPREKFGSIIGHLDDETMRLVEAALSLRLGLVDYDEPQ